jgi:hypothetical protein
VGQLKRCANSCHVHNCMSAEHRAGVHNIYFKCRLLADTESGIVMMMIMPDVLNTDSHIISSLPFELKNMPVESIMCIYIL